MWPLPGSAVAGLPGPLCSGLCCTRPPPGRFLSGLAAGETVGGSPGGSHAPPGSPGGALEAPASSGQQCALSAGSQGARPLARKLAALWLTQPRSSVTQGGGPDSCVCTRVRVRACACMCTCAHVCVCACAWLLKQPQTSTEKLEGKKSMCLCSMLTSVNTSLASSGNCIKVFFLKALLAKI